jgi:hypothetical protein
MKQCVNGLRWKGETEFNWRYEAFGICHATCRECYKVHRDNWYQKSDPRQARPTVTYARGLI